MSLIELRKSIAGVTSVFKTTSAMRIVAMSLHASLKKTQDAQERFVYSIDNLIHDVSDQNILKPVEMADKKTLFVCIGSQKGFCGSYNQEIAAVVQRVIKNTNNKNASASLIILGKELHALLHNVPTSSLILEGLTKYTVSSNVDFIIHHARQEQCTSITFIYMKAKNLFSRAIVSHTLALSHHDVLSEKIFTGHFSERKVIRYLFEMQVENVIRSLLLQAFLSEQAARFTAMDNASKNAEESIAKKRLTYNKLRQSSITKELQDLVANWAS